MVTRKPITKDTKKDTTKVKKESNAADKLQDAEDDDEDDLISSIIVDLNKKDSGAAMTLENATHAQVNGWIPSGHPDIDDVLSGGRGWPLGRVVELFGPESNGKTTVALHAIAEIQKMGGIAIFLDTEHALDRSRAKTIGVNLKKMIYAQPETMEDVFEFIEEIIGTIRKKDPNRPVLIVWDSVAATAARVEVEGDYGDHNVGVHGRIMSQGFRKINPLINKEKICFMCINQVRDKVGVTFGEKTSTPGGRALKFYASVRLEVIKIGQYKEGSEVAGIKCIATAKKNKVSPPFKKADFNIVFDPIHGGIDGMGALLDKGFDAGIFGDSKGWYVIDDKKYRKSDARVFLKENPDTAKKFYDTLSAM
ncbi:recombinase RecA [Bacillus paranthracis]|uniref:recombinase RecA n=1 Tax=Bacillus paranthracis TaxID=2026186 RepID=UPI0022DF6FC9|nr:DNA recombination/repair protein RecA [Bacillus paranthracis]